MLLRLFGIFILPLQEVVTAPETNSSAPNRIAMTQTIAALFVETNGVYFGLPDVDPWDSARDARKYDGPHSVVAHPPCERWGNYWSGGPSATRRRLLGDDAGCFASALASVARFGGVLEHPAGSRAWRTFGLPIPPSGGGWVVDGHLWSCSVEQGHYGHTAPKNTWLLASTDVPPMELTWSKSGRRGRVELLSRRQRMATPVAFRDALLMIARECKYASETYP